MTVRALLMRGSRPWQLCCCPRGIYGDRVGSWDFIAHMGSFNSLEGSSQVERLSFTKIP